MKKSNLTDKELLDLWRSSGLSQRNLAKQLGINFNKLHGRIFRAQKKEASRVSDKVEGNTRSLKSVSSRIKSLDDLIEACDIDLDEWVILRHEVKKWEGYRRNEYKDLMFDEGRISGYARDRGKITIEPLYSVFAVMVKREPEALEPVITPVNITVKPVKRVKPKKGKLVKALIIPDPHFGFTRNLNTGKLDCFHDRGVLGIALQLLQNQRFSKVVVLGDLLDLAEWSDKFVRSPEMYNTTQLALNEAAEFLARLSSLCDEVYVLEGNHEARMNNYLIKHMVQAYGLNQVQDDSGFQIISIPYLLGLNKIGVNYIEGYPDNEVWLGNQVRCIHGNVVRAGSGRTASAVVDDIQHTTIFGHIHRVEAASKTVWGKNGNVNVSAHSLGCACRVDGVVPGKKKKQNWQQALGVVEYSDEYHNITPLMVTNGRVVYHGEIYTE